LVTAPEDVHQRTLAAGRVAVAAPSA
jgi:hypothetical protein